MGHKPQNYFPDPEDVDWENPDLPDELLHEEPTTRRQSKASGSSVDVGSETNVGDAFDLSQIFQSTGEPHKPALKQPVQSREINLESENIQEFAYDPQQDEGDWKNLGTTSQTPVVPFEPTTAEAGGSAGAGSGNGGGGAAAAPGEEPGENPFLTSEKIQQAQQMELPLEEAAPTAAAGSSGGGGGSAASPAAPAEYSGDDETNPPDASPPVTPSQAAPQSPLNKTWVRAQRWAQRQQTSPQIGSTDPSSQPNYGAAGAAEAGAAGEEAVASGAGAVEAGAEVVGETVAGPAGAAAAGAAAGAADAMGEAAGAPEAKDDSQGQSQSDSEGGNDKSSWIDPGAFREMVGAVGYAAGGPTGAALGLAAGGLLGKAIAGQPITGKDITKTGLGLAGGALAGTAGKMFASGLGKLLGDGNTPQAMEGGPIVTGVGDDESATALLRQIVGVLRSIYGDGVIIRGNRSSGGTV